MSPPITNIDAVAITNGGAGYTAAPTVTFTNASGDITWSGAVGTVLLGQPTADPPHDDTFVPERVELGSFRAFIYQGRNVRVMGDEDLAYSHVRHKRDWPYNVDDATRSTVLPGHAWRSYRSARAACLSDFLGRMSPRTPREARAALMSVMRNVSNPIAAPGDLGGPLDTGDETAWRTLSDLTTRVYTFDNPCTLSTFHTDRKNLDFRSVADIRMLAPSKPSLHGNVTRLYRVTRGQVPAVVGR